MRFYVVIFRAVLFVTLFFISQNLNSQNEKANELPVVNIEISPVSKNSFIAPVWVKFYPINTYDPDGTIVLFEMDMNGDGIFDVKEKTLKGSSFEFKTPGIYTAKIKVTDNKGGITIKSQEFIIKEFDDQLVVQQEINTESIIPDTLNYIPEEEWEKTEISWIDVWNPNGSKIISEEIDSSQVKMTGFKSISPIISIEPEDGKSAVGALRIEMPENIIISEEDKSKVVLAFYEDAFSVSTGQSESRWRYHAVDFDEETKTYYAEMNHGCFITWGLITLGAGITYLVWDDATRLLLSKKSSNNFELHYSKEEITESQAKETLEILEKARTFLKKDISLGGLGLEYPSVPAKVDVYYVGIKSKEVTYGLYQKGKTGAQWIDLNNPSNIKNYDQNMLKATIAHELFHFVQYSLYNNAHYLWLNEALSTSVELLFVKSKKFIPGRKSPILNDGMYIAGLKNLKTDNEGYSAGLFINYLTYRFGNEIYSAILKECKRQIAASSGQVPFIALKRAITRIARKKYPTNSNSADLDFVWLDFTNAFIREIKMPELIDNRPKRTIAFTAKSFENVSINEKESIKKWDVKIPPLSLVPLASKVFNIKPLKWNKDNKAIVDCSVKFTPKPNPAFDISTRVDIFWRKGEKAYLPKNTLTKGNLNNKSNELNFTLNIDKKNRFNLLSFIPTGLGANAKIGETQASYELACKIRTEEKMDIGPDVPISTSAIDNYWWAYWRTAVTIKGSSNNKLDIINNSPLDGLYKAASNEWKPIREQIKDISKRKRVIDEKIRPLQDMYYKYYDQINKYSDSINALIVNKNITQSEYKSASQELESMTLPKAKISFLAEIINNYWDSTNPSSEVLNTSEIFSNIKTIGLKATVLVYPSRLRSFHLHSKELPSKIQIQNALDSFHKSISKISPAKKALDDFEKYWMENENEVNKIIEQIKPLFPSLK